MAKFKPTMIEGKPLKPNIRIEQSYKKKIESLTNAMTKEVERELKKLFKKESPAFFAEDASITSQSRILLSKLFKKYSRIFDIEGKKITNKMVSQANRHSKASVKASLESMKQGLTINVKDLSAETKEMIKASANQSASYIKSIQSQYLDKVEGYVYRSITDGNGLQDLVPNLQKLSGQTLRRSRMIAQDQYRKTSASLDKARMKQNGISKAVWRHASGGMLDPRKSHQQMDGKVFNLDEGLYDPEVGRKIQPSELVNCKCYYYPILEFDE